MQIVAFLAVLASTASAAAVPAKIARANTGALVAYDDINDGGQYEAIDYNIGSCYNFGNTVAGQVSSVAISAGDVCNFFNQPNCGGDYATISAPGSKDLTKVKTHAGASANDFAVSFLCIG